MKKQMCAQYIRMWPRGLFRDKENREYLKQELAKGGIYILYEGTEPYYVGKGAQLYSRLHSHLDIERRYGNHWDRFSAFLIPDPELRNQVEAILIAAMPTANGARPKAFKKIRMSRAIKKAYLKQLDKS